MTDELLKALELIKAECKKHIGCANCPLITSGNVCGVMDLEPCDWKLKKREVYF